MQPSPRATSSRLSTAIIAAVVIVGAGISIALWHYERTRENERIRTEFFRRADVRHTLTREIFNYYEAAIYSLRDVFAVHGEISRNEFREIAQTIERRYPGITALEWVPVVNHEDRAAVEAKAADELDRPFQFTERTPDGKMVTARERPSYLPILYLEPVTKNESALAYDISTGVTRAAQQRARESNGMVATGQIPLVQGARGIVIICPVYVDRTSSPPGRFLGFVQGVFAIQEMLEFSQVRYSTILDTLYLDRSATSSENELIYYRPAEGPAPEGEAPNEAEFRRGLIRENRFDIGGRQWTVLYRPSVSWVASQHTSRGLELLLGGLVITGLLALLGAVVARRTTAIQREVDERTNELAESRRQLSSLLQSLPGMAYRCRYDEQMTVIYVSEGAEPLTGYPPADFVSGAIHFRDLIHPDDVEPVRTATRTGLRERTSIEVEYRIRPRDGGEKWVLSRGHGVYDDRGNLMFFEGLAIDITTRKQAEMDKLTIERRLLDGQKLESLGLLAGGIAHDFNNLLTGVLGNASLARLTLTPGSAHDRQLEQVEISAQRAAELCRQMLAYAGKGRYVIEPINLSSLVESMQPLLEVSAGHQSKFTISLDRDIPNVRADATQLRQVIMNLVVNAAEAVRGKPGGEIVLRTGLSRLAESQRKGFTVGRELPPGDYVFLEVNDNGSGIAPAHLPRIFDPFFTTKFAGRGLGLAAVLGIVRGHEGALTVESAPGTGTTFRLYLTPFSSVARAAIAVAERAEGWRHEGEVLVIDDDSAVRTVTSELLKTFGLSPLTADDGASGIQLLKEHPNIDLVLLDLIMPGMSGTQTLTALREIRPNIRVLLISGYSDGDSLSKHGGEGETLSFLHKPFTRDALEEKLRDLLE